MRIIDIVAKYHWKKKERDIQLIIIILEKSKYIKDNNVV